MLTFDDIIFKDIDIVTRLQKICQECTDLKIVHNSAFDDKFYCDNFLKIHTKIEKFIKQWNNTQKKNHFTCLPSYDWSSLFNPRKRSIYEYVQFHNMLNIFQFELLKIYDTCYSKELEFIFEYHNELRILIENYYCDTSKSRIQLKYVDDFHVLLEDEDFNLFSFEKNYGDVFLSYNTIGVSHECFIPEIHKQAHTIKKVSIDSYHYIKPQISFSTDITIYLGDYINHNDTINELNELKNKGGDHRIWDASNKKNAFGLINIGKITNETISKNIPKI
tara:strand:+ start:444 stop:1274 length:831 start_codon:yes stop_codon:yes gene_type:complete